MYQIHKSREAKQGMTYQEMAFGLYYVTDEHRLSIARDFATRAEAQAWVREQKRRDRANA